MLSTRTINQDVKNTRIIIGICVTTRSMKVEYLPSGAAAATPGPVPPCDASSVGGRRVSTITLRKVCEPSKVPPPPDVERASLINTGGASPLDITT